MEPRITKAEAALMMPFTASHGAQFAEALRQQSARQHERDLAGRVRGVVARIGAWIERRRTEAELRALTDRELADIGLRRGDIPFVFAKAAVAPARAPRPVLASRHAGAVRAA